MVGLCQRINQSFPVGGYNNTCPSWNRMEIQNLIVGLVECGEIFVFVNYSDNQMVKLWERVVKSCETSSKSIKLGQSSVKIQSWF